MHRRPLSQDVSEQVDVNSGLVHVMLPSILGSLIAICAALVGISIGNPVQTALVLGILASPALAWFTTQERKGDYLFGIVILNGLFALMWFSPNAGFFCGGYLTMMIWVWMSLNWWKYELPSFRYGIWHSVGMQIGAFGGAVIGSGLV